MNTKEFEKQTLEKLLIDLKDIDNYKSFRKGAFVYDLGHYQGQLLLQELDKYKQVLDKIKENNQLIIDLGFDYDGFNNVDDLKDLIDELVDRAVKNKELLEEIE